MGNPKSREFRQQQEREAAWERARTTPRRPTELVRGLDSGVRRFQVVRCPSFSPSQFWEICDSGAEWALYRSDVVEARPQLMVIGYEQVKFPSVELHAFFKRLVRLSFPIAPDLSEMAGLDGETTELALFGSFHSEVRFTWWSMSPAGWKPMVKVVDEMLKAFSGAAI
jgi:hypothetical protein